jgi:hypothetical protein
MNVNDLLPNHDERQALKEIAIGITALSPDPHSFDPSVLCLRTYDATDVVDLLESPSVRIDAHQASPLTYPRSSAAKRRERSRIRLWIATCVAAILSIGTVSMFGRALAPSSVLVNNEPLLLLADPPPANFCPTMTMLFAETAKKSALVLRRGSREVVVIAVDPNPQTIDISQTIVLANGTTAELQEGDDMRVIQWKVGSTSSWVRVESPNVNGQELRNVAAQVKASQNETTFVFDLAVQSINGFEVTTASSKDLASFGTAEYGWCNTGSNPDGEWQTVSEMMVTTQTALSADLERRTSPKWTSEQSVNVIYRGALIKATQTIYGDSQRLSWKDGNVVVSVVAKRAIELRPFIKSLRPATANEYQALDQEQQKALLEAQEKATTKLGHIDFNGADVEVASLTSNGLLTLVLRSFGSASGLYVSMVRLDPAPSLSRQYEPIRHRGGWSIEVRLSSPDTKLDPGATRFVDPRFGDIVIDLRVVGPS